MLQTPRSHCGESVPFLMNIQKAGGEEAGLGTLRRAPAVAGDHCCHVATGEAKRDASHRDAELHGCL